MEIVENCENESCVEEIENLHAQIAIYMKKCQETKQKYHAALIDNLKKDVVLLKLTNQEKEERFSDVNGQFPTGTLELLRTFGPSQKEDSSFVLSAVRGLYINRLPALKTKSYSGTSRKNVEKHALTPEKMNHLKNIFEQRINYVDEVSAGERNFFFQNMSINKSN